MEYTELDKHELINCMTTVSAKVNEPEIWAYKRKIFTLKRK